MCDNRGRMKYLHKIISFGFAISIVLGVCAPVSATTIITASGDYGSSTNAGKVIDGIAAENPTAHLVVGDISYGTNSDVNNESNWCSFTNSHLSSGGIDTSTFPFQIVAGNHEDDRQENGFIDDFVACLPDRMTSTGTYGAQYYFDIGTDARVIMVSPDLTINSHVYTYTNGDADYNTVSGWIDDARTANIKWIIIGMHEDCLTVGNKSTCQVGDDLMNLLIDKNVDVIIHGHDHTYQRSKQLQLSGTCSSLSVNSYNSDCAVTSKPTNAYTKGNGPVDIIVATGGRSAYDIHSDDTEANYFLRASGSNNNQSFGNLVLTINGNELEGEFKGVTGAYNDKFIITNTSQYLVNDYDTTTDLVGDYTGNGQDDIATITTSGDTLTWRVAKSTGGSFSSKGVWATDFGNDGDGLFTGDFNGDGKADIAYSRVVDANTVKLKVAKSTGSRFKSSTTWSSDLGNQNSQYYVGDFNGDKKDDIAFSQTTGNTINWKVALSTGHSFRYDGTWISDLGNNGDTFYIGDFTGNGSDDIAYMRPESQTRLSWRVASSKGHHFIYRGKWAESMGNTDDTFKVADTNGDRRDDIVYVRHGNFATMAIKRANSTGRSFRTPVSLTRDFGNDGDRYRIGDFNGNGKEDLALIHASGASTLSWKVAWLNRYSYRGTWSSDFGSSTSTF